MRVMPNRSRRSRAAGPELKGRLRAAELARRLGVALREARLHLRLSQRQVATWAGVSQSWVSLMERGRGAGASLETWASVTAAVDEQLVAYLERAPGASRPRDHAHLRGQELVIRTARSGGWLPLPEAPLDPTAQRSRSVDVLLARGGGMEVAVVEIWDWFDDVGAAMRSLDGKIAAAGGSANEGRQAGGLWVVRGTRRNHLLAAELHALFGAKFPGSSSAWLRALTDPGIPMPHENGLVWVDVDATRLIRVRLRR